MTEQIQQNFANFSDRLIPISSKNPWIAEIYRNTDIIIVAVGSKYMIPVMQELAVVMKPWSGMVNVAKGLSPNGNIFLDEFLALWRDDLSYAALAWGMAAKDVMEWMPRGASIAATSPEFGTILEELLWSASLQIHSSTDVRGVEMAGILKNIVSIQAWYHAVPDDEASIDAIVESSVTQIKTHADQLKIQASTFDHTYCRDHPEYGDIRTSCYGGTRNFMLGQLRKKKWSLSDAIQHCIDQWITVEWANTLKVLEWDPDHPLHVLPFVHELVSELNKQ